MKSIWALVIICFAAVLYQSEARSQAGPNPRMYTDDARANIVAPNRKAKLYRFNEWYNLDGEMIVCADTKKSLCVSIADSVPKGYEYIGFEIKDRGILVVYMGKK